MTPAKIGGFLFWLIKFFQKSDKIEHPKKGDEYRDNTGKEFPKIPHISPKKVHKSTHYKKGVSPTISGKREGKEKVIPIGTHFWF